MPRGNAQSVEDIVSITGLPDVAYEDTPHLVNAAGPINTPPWHEVNPSAAPSPGGGAMQTIYLNLAGGISSGIVLLLALGFVALKFWKR